MFSIIAAGFLTSAIAGEKDLEVGKKAPKIETITGTNVGYDANSENKTKVISFWTPKKPESRINNRKLYQEYGTGEADTEFISICTDDDKKLMEEVLKIDKISGENNYSYDEISSRVFKDYRVEEYPRAFKISAQGKILEII